MRASSWITFPSPSVTPNAMGIREIGDTLGCPFSRQAAAEESFETRPAWLRPGPPRGHIGPDPSGCFYGATLPAQRCRGDGVQSCGSGEDGRGGEGHGGRSYWVAVFGWSEKQQLALRDSLVTQKRIGAMSYSSERVRLPSLPSRYPFRMSVGYGGRQVPVGVPGHSLSR